MSMQSAASHKETHEDLSVCWSRQAPPWSPARSLLVLDQLAKQLDDLHALGKVHGAVNPNHIVLDPSNKVSLRPAEWSHSREVASHHPAAFNTVYYLSPEQTWGEKPTSQSDVYAVGALMYHLLTGVPPFSGDDIETVLRGHRGEKPRPASQLRSDLPPAVDGILERALRKDPKRRFHQVSDIVQELRGIWPNQPDIANAVPPPAPIKHGSQSPPRQDQGVSPGPSAPIKSSTHAAANSKHAVGVGEEQGTVPWGKVNPRHDGRQTGQPPAATGHPALQPPPKQSGKGAAQLMLVIMVGLAIFVVFKQSSYEPPKGSGEKALAEYKKMAKEGKLLPEYAEITKLSKGNPEKRLSLTDWQLLQGQAMMNSAKKQMVEMKNQINGLKKDMDKSLEDAKKEMKRDMAATEGRMSAKVNGAIGRVQRNINNSISSRVRDVESRINEFQNAGGSLPSDESFQTESE